MRLMLFLFVFVFFKVDIEKKRASRRVKERLEKEQKQQALEDSVDSWV